MTLWKLRWRTLVAFWTTVLALMHHQLEEVTNDHVKVNSGPKLCHPKKVINSHSLFDQGLEDLGEEGRVFL